MMRSWKLQITQISWWEIASCTKHQKERLEIKQNKEEKSQEVYAEVNSSLSSSSEDTSEEDDNFFQED